METYTIGQAAARTGRTVSALRYYDKEGLLPFVERSAGGQRLFKEEDFAYISMIDCLKNTGVPIRDIKNTLTGAWKETQLSSSAMTCLYASRRGYSSRSRRSRPTWKKSNIRSGTMSALWSGAPKPAPPAAAIG